MKIKEAISQAQIAAPDVIENGTYISWLSRLDWQIKKEVFDHYIEDVEYSGYNSDTSIETELLVSPPYDELYVRYLEAQVYRYLGETIKYNNCITEFNAIYRRFQAHYNSEHTHKGPHNFTFFGGA